jgi:hypothetical protein
MGAPISSRPTKQTPWQRVDAAFVPLPDSPTGLSPALQTILRRGWMEALALRVERRRRDASLGLPPPRPWPPKYLLRKVAERRFYENSLRWYARTDLWAMLRAEVWVTLDLLDLAIGTLPGKVWIPLLLEECRRINLLYTELRHRVDGGQAEDELKRLLAELEGPDLFPRLKPKIAQRQS